MTSKRPSPNEGARQLRATGKSTREIAAEIQTASHETARRWLSGARPNQPQRARLKELYAIPEGAWDQKPIDSGPPSSSELPSLAPNENDPEAIAKIKEQIGRFEEALKDTSLSDRARVEIERNLGIALRDWADRSSDLTDAQLIDSARFRDVVRHVVAALEPFPDARVAVLDALEKVTAKQREEGVLRD